jgi:hypothetical protein
MPYRAQRFLPAYRIDNLFHLRRDHRSPTDYRAARIQAFQAWDAASGAAARTGPRRVRSAFPRPRFGKWTASVADNKKPPTERAAAFYDFMRRKQRG